jgi:hypothetical protein
MKPVEGGNSESDILRRWYDGSCHCGNVRFRLLASLDLILTECNCEICYKSGHLELMVPDDRFELLCGSEFLREYRFANCIADHTFCIVCGVRPFYRPRSHPVGFKSVNARCVDLGGARSKEICAFDGRNWAQSIAQGQHKLSE